MCHSTPSPFARLMAGLTIFTIALRCQGLSPDAGLVTRFVVVEVVDEEKK